MFRLRTSTTGKTKLSNHGSFDGYLPHGRRATEVRGQSQPPWPRCKEPLRRGLMYREVDLTTGAPIGDRTAVEMTAEIWDTLLSVGELPGFY